MVATFDVLHRLEGLEQGASKQVGERVCHRGEGEAKGEKKGKKGQDGRMEGTCNRERDEGKRTPETGGRGGKLDQCVVHLVSNYIFLVHC